MIDPTIAVRVLEMVRECGPRETYRRFIAENDRMIAGADLDHGRDLVSHRTTVHTTLIREWAANQQKLAGYDHPFAVVALGGTGRGEITPRSDLDIAFLFDDAIEGNRFLLDLQRQTLHTDRFADEHGFAFTALPFGLDDVPDLADKQLNSFLDMSPLHDPCGLAETFRERIRLTFDPFEHFLHVRGFWKRHWEAAAASTENLHRFDIKNDGLRLFLGGVWTLSGQNFRHSQEVYATLNDPRDLEAYEFLLRIRAWGHLRRKPEAAGLLGNHAEDVLGFDDFCSFGEMLGPDATAGERFEFATMVRARLLSARRRVAAFARGVIERELRVGRQVPPDDVIVLKTGGLQHSRGLRLTHPEKRSRAALGMLLASQRYGVPVDSSELQTTLRNMGDWLVRVPELSALFYETRGSLADTIEFLTQLDGAAERLFPGYGRFEASLDERVMIERKSLRGAWVREKLRALDACLAHGNERLSAARGAWNPLDADLREMVCNETVLLDADHLAAVKLALLTKRLPLTPEDEAARANTGLPLHEREASGFSGIPLDRYYQPFVTEAGFSPETARVARFLVTHRRVLKRAAESGINDDSAVARLVSGCGDEMTMRSLFVFSCMDSLVGVSPETAALTESNQREWWLRESDPARWFNIRELYIKALARHHPDMLPDAEQTLRSAGYVAEEQEILRDFGADFFSGLYGRHARRFGSHLLHLVDEPDAGPRAALLRDGGTVLLGIAARDFRGLAACISGTLWQCHLNLRQAHLFCATNHQLALDFFHLAPGSESIPANLPRLIEDAISRQAHIADDDEAQLPALLGQPELDAMPSGNFRLRYETEHDTAGLVYALSYKVFRHLGGGIHGLSANTVRGRTYITVIHSLPENLTLSEARAIVSERF
ncbi:MAG: hypothetical protein J0M04_12770 [Verrucomicrobia bacterium]|nr:hypothetical protein [Verrucomicrobiota bacterium]